jgi:hypothetical protein
MFGRAAVADTGAVSYRTSAGAGDQDGKDAREKETT